MLGTVATGVIATLSVITGLKNESLLYIPIGLTLSLLIGDILILYGIIASYNSLVAILTVSPMATLFVFAVLEWVRSPTT